MAKDEAYYEAEKKIEQVLRSESRELSLYGMRLKKLPASLSELTELQSLTLSYNELETLPEDLSKLVQLRSIDISNNHLKILPASLGKLKKLSSLNLDTNKLVSFPISFSELKLLTSLILRNNHISIFPAFIENLERLQLLNISVNDLTYLPETLGTLKQLRTLDVSSNQIEILPEAIGKLPELNELYLYKNQLRRLPSSISLLRDLKKLDISDNKLISLPEAIGQIKGLYKFNIANNKLTDLPASLASIDSFDSVVYYENSALSDSLGNPLNRELTAACKDGLNAVKAYLRAKAAAGQITLIEAKLILIGEGEVGKTCLMDALLGKEWQEHPSTHGIEIQQVKLTDTNSKKIITLNAWDFGGQRVYRPTHQLFFSAPAVYLVVWKPREGSQAGQVKEWIQLVKRREPSAKILVVATHGGPQLRQPDIDRQELWDLFGKETVVDFFFVESKPDKLGNRKGIEELKHVIARVAAEMPEVGRSVPKSFADVRQALKENGTPYLPLQEVLDLCLAHGMDDEIARLFIAISHRLGHLTHYENDPTLRDIVILRPDWLATAMSYVLDDEETRNKHGLVNFSRLSHLWNDLSRPAEDRYPEPLHPIFLRLMERFDLSYRVADPFTKNENGPISLIGQLVPDIRPSNITEAWGESPLNGDVQQTQICRIVEAGNGQSANAEGLFYQLIVRLHKYSLGRVDYNASVHWQRGLVLEDNFKGRAFLEHVNNDVRIIVRSPFPEGLLGMLTREVKYLVESFWEGLRCDIMVPCLSPCGKTPGTGMFEVEKLMVFKKQGMNMFPCMISGCNQAQNIDALLRNAPATQPDATALIFAEFAEVKAQIESVRQQGVHRNQIYITGNVAQSNIIIGNENKVDSSIHSSPIGQFDRLDVRTRRILSQVEKTYTDLLRVLTDEAKEGPRLFSFFPVDRSNFDPKEWIRAKFRLVLWCEHSRLPLPVLNGSDSKKGVYDLELDREWFKKASPYLKLLTGTLGMVLPVASSVVKLALDETAYKLIEEQLDFSKSVIDATIGTSGNISDFMSKSDSIDLEHGIAVRGNGSTLRELHSLLKGKDPGFGGLVRVMNKQQEFLWVHEKFAGEY